MTEAIFGLIGVIIGGLISGGINLFLQQRKERLSAKVSARLVRDDLYLAACWIEDAVTEGEWEYGSDRKINEQAWNDHRAQLAAVLAYDDYASVGLAYQAVQKVNNWIDKRQEHFNLNDGDQQRFKSWLEDLRKGLTVLLKVAK
jgi:hypothetical protein